MYWVFPFLGSAMNKTIILDQSAISEATGRGEHLPLLRLAATA